jgi:hypothetical protein
MLSLMEDTSVSLRGTGSSSVTILRPVGLVSAKDGSFVETPKTLGGPSGLATSEELATGGDVLAARCLLERLKADSRSDSDSSAIDSSILRNRNRDEGGGMSCGSLSDANSSSDGERDGSSDVSADRVCVGGFGKRDGWDRSELSVSSSGLLCWPASDVGWWMTEGRSFTRASSGSSGMEPSLPYSFLPSTDLGGWRREPWCVRQHCQ